MHLLLEPAHFFFHGENLRFGRSDLLIDAAVRYKALMLRQIAHFFALRKDHFTAVRGKLPGDQVEQG